MIVQSWMEMLQPHPISLLLDTFLEHFLELKLCIPYVDSKLGKSGVQFFKWYMIWSWNKKVMAIWRWMRKAEREFRSRGAISKGVSQLRNHPLAHECHFAAAVSHFAAAKWAAKIPSSTKSSPHCGNDLQASKMGCDLLFYVFFSFWLPNGYKMTFKLQNGCENVSIFSMICEAPLWLRNDFAAP